MQYRPASEHRRAPTKSYRGGCFTQPPSFPEATVRPTAEVQHQKSWSSGSSWKRCLYRMRHYDRGRCSRSRRTLVRYRRQLLVPELFERGFNGFVSFATAAAPADTCDCRGVRAEMPVGNSGGHSVARESSKESSRRIDHGRVTPRRETAPDGREGTANRGTHNLARSPTEHHLRTCTPFDMVEVAAIRVL